MKIAACFRAIFFVLIVMILSAAGPAPSSQRDSGGGICDSYCGNYRVAEDHMLGVDRFVMDSGETALLISDYRTGIVRRLFPVSGTEFTMGPNFDVKAPVELTVEFGKDKQGNVGGMTLQPTGGVESFAMRVPLKEEDVTFNNGDAKLSGTLMVPASEGPHPAIILLHGSGPLTRYSFGPYPHFFTSLGFAVLIYDKRGVGASTGTLMDASTGLAMSASMYPDELVDDALAGFRSLQQHNGIDPKRIGVWGSSEGGMLATQVAARSRDVAFAIDSSGFMGPLWQTTLYQATADPRHYGAPEKVVQESVAFTKQWLDVARTGEGWDAFLKRREEIRQKNKYLLSWSSGEFKSLEQMRWYWNHVLAFSPLPALRNVTCPVLGVFGELDTSTEASVAAANMQRVLLGAGNKDVTVKIFPGAGHSLAVASGDRMAPGVFDTLRSWLLTRVHVGRPSSR
jgi:pimeloyl-ACP methyl ester carboxylesterase